MENQLPEKFGKEVNKIVEGTLCWILKDGKALLQFKKRGISEGKWNAVGGKVEHGETPLEGVKREVFEETGLKIEEPKYYGRLNFFFGKGDADRLSKPWVVHVFLSDEFTGELSESEEGELKWFSLDEIPFDKMWQDDEHWVPLMLAGKNFEGEFFFSDDGSKLLMHELHEPR